MKPHPCLLTLAGSLLGAMALHAADAAPEQSAPAPEPYQLKNRSAFAATGEDARAPFWPVGWVHRQGVSSQVGQVVAAKTVLDEKSFRVTSILLGSGAAPSLAVINGRAYGEGELLKMPRGMAVAAPALAGTSAAPAAARIRVQRISDGSIVLQQADQTVTVALQRPELVLKKSEEPLLEEER